MTERSQFIYIHSSQCTGAPYDFTYHLTPGLVKCDPATETMSVALVRWTTRLDWYNIRAPYNGFSMTYNGMTRGYVIPEGNYTYAAFAARLSSILNADKANLGVTTGDIVVSFDPLTCKLSILFPNTAGDRTMTVPDYKKDAYGFGTTAKTTVGALITSDRPMNFWFHEERLLIRCDGLHPRRGRSVTHTAAAGTVDTGSVMASVLANAIPFETIVYESDGLTFQHHIVDHHLTGALQFRITELDGAPADYVGDNHIVLKVTIHANTHDIGIKRLNALKSIEDYMRLSFIAQHLGAGSIGDGKAPPAAAAGTFQKRFTAAA